MKRIDLHTHSSFSDGTLTPNQLVTLAKEKGISAIALTDHDTIEGLEEGSVTAIQQEIEFINGVELTSNYFEKEIHILGYFFDKNSESFKKELSELSENRKNRNIKMLNKMRAEGLDINEEDFEKDPLKSQITRAHFAKALCKKGYCKTFEEAFLKYLTKGAKTFIDKEELSPKKCLDMIKNASGLTAVAHPFLYKMDKIEIDKMVRYFKEIGLDAIETVYSTNTTDQELYTRHLAKKYGLKITGGSDYHGEIKPKIDLGVGFGNLYVDYSLLENLRLSYPNLRI